MCVKVWTWIKMKTALPHLWPKKWVSGARCARNENLQNIDLFWFLIVDFRFRILILDYDFRFSDVKYYNILNFVFLISFLIFYFGLWFNFSIFSHISKSDSQICIIISDSLQNFRFWNSLFNFAFLIFNICYVYALFGHSSSNYIWICYGHIIGRKL